MKKVQFTSSTLMSKRSRSFSRISKETFLYITKPLYFQYAKPQKYRFHWCVVRKREDIWLHGEIAPTTLQVSLTWIKLSVFDSRAFHFDQREGLESLYVEQPLDKLDDKLESIASNVMAFPNFLVDWSVNEP